MIVRRNLAVQSTLGVTGLSELISYCRKGRFFNYQSLL